MASEQEWIVHWLTNKGEDRRRTEATKDLALRQACAFLREGLKVRSVTGPEDASLDINLINSFCRRVWDDL